MTLDLVQVKAIENASGHSVFGGSSLPRIVECPASVGEELKAGLAPASVYAAKGSMLHGVTERALRHMDPRGYVFAQDLNIEDSSYVLDAIEYVQEVILKHGGKDVVTLTPNENGTYERNEIDLILAQDKIAVLLEAYGDLSSYGIPESRGSADVVIMSLLRTDVIDHKFGHGVPVYAEKNYQLVAYLGMAVPFTDTPDSDHKLYVHINQPTIGIYDEWPVPWGTLNQMLLGDVYDAVQLAKGDNPPFGPSAKACRFCNANKNCKHRHNFLVAQSQLIQGVAKNPSHVPNEVWAKFLDAADAITEAISQIKQHAVSEIQKGRDFPGFKLVSGRSNRVFLDEEQGHKIMERRLGKRAFQEPKYITLAQAEKIDPDLKKNDKWKKCIHKPDGAPKLVRADAPGKALVYGVKGLMDQLAREDNQ
jgi:hypothetical protein